MFGEHLIRETGMFPHGRDPESMGKRWIELNRQRLCELVCPSAKLRAHLESQSVSNYTSAVAIIVPLIREIAIPGSVALVAWILVREGVTRLCRDQWCD